MSTTDYDNDITGAKESARGSDHRLNVSARSDSRGAYNSRDEGDAHSLTFDHQGAVAGEFSVYWKNSATSNKRVLVFSEAEVNALQSARVKIHRVTGIAAGGTVISPVNQNTARGVSTESTCRQSDSGDAITGLTSAGVIGFTSVPGDGTVIGNREYHFDDRLRVAQGDAIAIEYDEGTTGDFFGTLTGYFERIS